MSATPTVLIVEDNDEIAEAFAALLKDQGYTVVTASDGAEGIRQLRSIARPCIILLDIMMPGEMDGWAFRDAQLADPQLANVPTIVVSALGLAEETKAKRLGMGFFRKPVVEMDALLAAIRQHCHEQGASG